MARRIQYDQFVSGTSNAQALERVSLDKFYRNTEVPDSNWKKVAAYSVAALAPFFFFVNVAPQTVPVIDQPSVNVTYQTTTQYKALAYTDRDIITSEAVSADSYHPDFIYDIKRQQYTYPYHTDIQPKIPIVSPVIDINHNIIFRQRITQYQQLAFTPSSRIETITIDKWNPQKPDKIFDIQRNQYLYPSISFNPELLTSQEVITPDKWLGEKPDFVFDVKRQQYTYPVTFPDPSELNNLGKWLGNHPDKVFDVIRQQYLYPSFTEGLNSATVYPNSWHPEIQRPPKDVVRQQYLYEYQFFVNQNPKIIPVISGTDVNVRYDTTTQYQGLAQSPFFISKVSVDMWHPISNEPYLDLQRKQYLNPSHFFTEAQFGEITTVDKWVGYQPSFVYDVKRQQHIYPVLAHIFAPSATIGIFTPVQNTIVYKVRFQYQSLAFPLPILVLPDKWLGQYPNINFDLKRQQYLYPVYFAELAQVNNHTVDQWIGYHPDYVFDVARRQYNYPVNAAFDFREIPTQEPESAFGNHPDKVFDITRNQYLYPSFFAELTQVNNHTADQWAGYHPDYIYDVKRQQYTYPFETRVAIDETLPAPWNNYSSRPDKIFDLQRNQYLYPSEFRTEILTPVSEPISADSYHPDKLFDVVRSQYLYPFEFRVDKEISTQEPINSESYHPDYVFDTKRQQYLYPSSVIDVNQLIQPERTTPDKWLGNKPDFVFDLKHQQYTYPFLAFDAQPFANPATVDMWIPETQRPPKDVIRNQYLYPVSVLDPLQLTQHERITINKWIGQHPDFIYDVKRQQYSYPAQSAVDTSIVPVSQVYINEYNHLQSIPVWDLKRQQYSYPSEFRTEILTPVSEPISADSYHPDYVFDIRRQQYTYPNFFVDEKLLTQKERVSIDRFVGYHPDYIYDVARKQYEYSSETRTQVVTAPLAVTEVHAYYPNIIYDIRRQQYGYPSVSIGRFINYFLLYPPTSGVAIDRLNSVTGGMSKDRINAPLGGSSTDKLASPTGGSSAV